ncbi:cell division protein Fic [Catellatospora sp. TT07R-123]|uniref:Fic family protein n=1 Tax=Catellatospora sp. TT07R-123 TaxID=2733863 RepID=UPI001B24234A|nr:Fic family protein [Catellatospora sp. TT07R-123]GHJ45443.1 cell division protein Fic [Catellatospora sp. TT07R-123]
MLLQTPKLDDDDLRVLGEIEQMRRDLQLHVRAHPRWTGQLRRELFAAAVQGSNTIEQITVSMSDARAAVEGQTLSADVDEQTQLAILGYRDAMTFVQQTPLMANFSYGEMLLASLHFMILKYNLPKWPGRYRAGGIYVTSNDPLEPAYTGPDADVVPELMRELVEWLNDGDLDQPALVRGAMAHLNLVCIHPWRDGNGRMGRCLHTLVLARDGVLAPEFSSIEQWLGDQVHTVQYYQALQETQGGSFQPERDARPWLRFALTAHHKQAQLVQRRVDYSERLWRELERVAAERGLPERTVSALYAAALGELRRTTYQGDEELTRDQAIRDVQALVKHGLVRPLGNARTRVYLIDGVAKDAHLASVDAVRKPMREPYREIERERRRA